MSPEKEENKRNVLICVAGLTPQIITETVYVLAVKENIRIDEILVITSTTGKKTVRERLFDSGKWREFCNDFPGQTRNLKFNLDCLEILKDADKQELPDIRSTAENELAANQICEIVKKLCEKKDTKIYASVAGGRKTMGNYLAFAMSLFARTDDSLSHVLVDEKFERQGKPPLDFYYEPPTPRQVADIKGNPEFLDAAKTAPLMTDMANTTLANIPFVRLREIGISLLEETGAESYKQIVDKIQSELKLKESANYELRIDLRNNYVRVVETNSNLSSQVKLSLRELFAFALFAFNRKENLGTDGFMALSEIGDERLDFVCQEICHARGQPAGIEDFSFFPRSDFIRNLYFATAKSIVYLKKCARLKKIKKRPPHTGEVKVFPREVEKYIVKNWREIIGKIVPKFDAVFPQTATFKKFYIQRQGGKAKYIFGLKIEPNRIKFEK
jgi:CRISPR-associated protein (TIGR02584 family)